MSSGRFQQKLRCGFNCALQRREPSARSWKGGTRASPGPAQHAPAPLWGPSSPHTPLLPTTCTLLPPSVAPYPAASRPQPPRAFLQAAAPGQNLRPHLLQLSSPLGRRAPWPPGGPGIHRDRGLIFNFPVLGPLLSCQDLIKAQPAPADSPGPGSGSQ